MANDIHQVQKDLHPMVRKALKQGWTLDTSGKGHPKIRKGSQMITLLGPHKTASPRMVNNFRRAFKAAGIEV